MFAHQSIGCVLCHFRPISNDRETLALYYLLQAPGAGMIAIHSHANLAAMPAKY
jgi:hypothetical protein